MQKPENDGNRRLLIPAALSAAVLLLLYLGYSFDANFPYWSIDPHANANFTMLYLFAEKAVYLTAAAAIIFAAFCAGQFVIGFLRLQGLPAVEEGTLAAGLGLGAFSLATLGLGLLGFLNAATAFGVLAFSIILGWRRMRCFFRRPLPADMPRWSPAEIIFAALAAAAAVLTVVYSFNPPTDFDVLEYHLAAPAWFARTGTIRYIRYNVYSNFPLNSEMLHLLSMTLTGSKLSGAILGKVVHGLASLVAAAAAYSLGRWLFSRGAGIFAAAALLGAGGFFMTATAGYVEPLQVLYTVLAVLMAGRFIAGGGNGTLLAAAAATGLAMGVKYPAAVFVALPLAAAVSLLRRESRRERLIAFVTFSGVAVAVAAPWLLKNLAMTGNPVYPLLYAVFGGRDWSDVQEARWAFAHTPKGGLALEQWARHVFGTFFANEMVPLLAVLFVPVFFFTRRTPKRVFLLIVYCVYYVFVWFAVTHRIDRFLLPAVAVLAAVSGAGLFSLPAGAIKRMLAGLAAALLAMNVFLLAGLYGQAQRLDPSVPLFGRYETFLRDNVPGYEAWEEVNRIVPADSRVILVGEAETFYLDVAYEGTTVFDRKPVEEMALEAGGDARATAEAIRASGARYIFINWATFRRQQETYAFPFEGRERPGYSDIIAPSFFDAMAATGIIRVVYESGPQVYPATRAYVLYRVD